MDWLYPEVKRVRSLVARSLRIQDVDIKGMDWGTYPDRVLVERAASMTQEVTGDKCSVIKIGSSYRIVRQDPSGKSVQPGDL